MSANKKQVTSLDDYRSRRQPGATPEPFGMGKKGAGSHVFVVQKHKARRLHFDLRLEWEGVLLSWAVPKGFSLDPSEKRLAVQTEPHPMEYADFEAVIPPSNYGAGAMIVWDRGTWIPLEDPDAGIEKGKLLFELKGYKLHGIWTLVRTRKDREWLLIKKPDGWAREGEQAEDFPQESILSGLTVEELAEGTGKARVLEQEVVESGAPRLKESHSDIGFMLARTARPFSRKGWIFELKYDGYRMMAVRQGPRVQLRYRKGSDVTSLYPELTRVLAAFPFEEFVLDGELVALDDSGRPDFQRLQGRAQRISGVDVDALALETPVTLFVFDLLVLAGRDLRSLPLIKRKAFLKRILPSRGPIRYADHVEEAGKALFEQVQDQGLEGVIAKRALSAYKAGRSGSWLKMPADQTSDFVVVGYTLPKGGRQGFGALHLATFDRGSPMYAGRVGTGFSDQFLRDFSKELEAIQVAQPQCQGPVPRGRQHKWVKPRYVAHVRYKKRTAEGLLRQPSFLRLGPDLTPEVLRSETPEEDVSSGAPLQGNTAENSEEPKLAVTNPDKVFWPEDQLTKGDLIEYYRSIGEWILPYLRGRPVVLDRYPDGIHGKSFFQKNVPDYVPSWVRTAQIWEEGDTRGSNLFICDDLDSLLYLANLATIPLHIWSSRVESIRYPDWCVIDLDPKEAPFKDVVKIALRLRELCQELGIEPFLKTTGGSGLHLLIPLGTTYTHEQSKLLAELLARIVSAELPEIATLERTVDRREGKVYIDCYQNGQGKLIVAPFSVRPYPRAPVSTPLQWEELTRDMDVRNFNMKSVPERMQALQFDPMRGVLEKSTDLARVIERLSRWA